MNEIIKEIEKLLDKMSDRWEEMGEIDVEDLDKIRYELLPKLKVKEK